MEQKICYRYSWLASKNMWLVAILLVLLSTVEETFGWQTSTPLSTRQQRHFASKTHYQQHQRHQQCWVQRRTTATTTTATTTTTTAATTTCLKMVQRDEFQHTLAILSMPSTSFDKIANEAILNHAVQHTRKMSVVLQAQGNDNTSLSSLRRYVGEVYSMLWDVAMSTPEDFCDVVVYPQNLPNAAPQQWIHHTKDLDSVCSHDTICGWTSMRAGGRGLQFQSNPGDGLGGLDAHVAALNADRAQRDLPPVQALHVDNWPLGASSEWQVQNQVTFIDDEEDEGDSSTMDSLNGSSDKMEEELTTSTSSLIGGARIPSTSLFQKVAVGGTFDGMHYGHRKLLTLAVSSVSPISGKLTIGVTVDDMLKHKAYAEQIPNISERMDGVRDFIYRLAPGIKNNVKIVPISDEFGPPGKVDEGADYDALVLSHETLSNGYKLNRHRREVLGYDSLTLLCTRRTEPHGMSSTALRKKRWEIRQRLSKSNAS